MARKIIPEPRVSSTTATSQKALDANSEANKKPTFDLEKTIKKLTTQGAAIMQDYRGGTKKLKNYLAEVAVIYRILQGDPKALLALSELYRKYSISTNSGPFQPFTRLVLGLYGEATEAFILEFCIDQDGFVDEIAAEEERAYRQDQIKACSRWSKAWGFAYKCWINDEVEHPIDVFNTYGGVHGCIAESKRRELAELGEGEEEDVSPDSDNDPDTQPQPENTPTGALITLEPEKVIDDGTAFAQRFKHLVDSAASHPIAKPFKLARSMVVEKEEYHLALVRIEKDGKTVTPLELVVTDEMDFQSIMNHHMEVTTEEEQQAV
ncbi:hypothetical protein GCM10011332_21320 [Terasakiella brassicae]|uniref:Uncharacterized protein n=1 Tax=Terasakiella brassicae TaxID=1634917 RepID=A0A917FCS7_9PROT|nr:hypothetical protein [Terasakiella brassicae]GGF66958.1 hypothetical protein GCM10011332_21320 [Terasakiella brassicae]